jgi:hypothetical protein
MDHRCTKGELPTAAVLFSMVKSGVKVSSMCMLLVPALLSIDCRKPTSAGAYDSHVSSMAAYDLSHLLSGSACGQGHLPVFQLCCEMLMLTSAW